MNQRKRGRHMRFQWTHTQSSSMKVMEGTKGLVSKNKNQKLSMRSSLIHKNTSPCSSSRKIRYDWHTTQNQNKRLNNNCHYPLLAAASIAFNSQFKSQYPGFCLLLWFKKDRWNEEPIWLTIVVRASSSLLCSCFHSLVIMRSKCINDSRHFSKTGT